VIYRFITIVFLTWTVLSAGEFRESFNVRHEETFFSLSHTLVTVDSVHWENPSDTLRWALDPVEGRWVVLEKPQKEQRVEIFYSTPDWELPIRYTSGVRYRTNLFSGNEREEERISSRDETISDVSTRGTLFRSVQVSTGGQSSISGGMDLKIRGELLPDVMLTGVISDHETPFESRMSSQSLEELDRIYLELSTPAGTGRIGDVPVRTEWSPFSRYSGRLTGLTASNTSAKDRTVYWEAFAGSPSGRFIRQEIQVREGDQGPYRLIPPSLGSVMIVPGSERVFLNGEQLPSSRYLMDYAAAELTFSTGRILSREDRVYVEYRYRNEWYPRLSAGGHVTYTRNNHGLRMYALRESDDGSRPLDETLANTDPDSLDALIEGDYLTTAIADTTGDYILLQDGYWMYAGEGEGTHRVRFFRDNQNGGYIRRYRDDGLPYYAYAPDHPLSQYFPRRAVVFPETLSHFGAGWQWKLFQGELTANLTASRYDRSFKKGNGKTGYGGTWTAHIPISKLIVESNGWIRSMDFISYEPMESVSFSREMGFHPRDTLRLNARTALSYETKVFRSGLEWQSAGLTPDSLRNRLGFSGSLGDKFRLSWTGFRLRESYWLPYYQAELNGEIRGKRTLYTGWKRIHFEPLNRSYAERSELYKAGLRFAGESSSEYRYREDFEWTGTNFKSYSQKHELEIKGGFRKQEYIRWQGEFTGRLDKRDAGDSFYLLTSNRLHWSVPVLKFAGQLTTQINRTSESRREALFIKVGEGMGQYRWDADYEEYVPDPLGNYVLRREQTNDRRDQVVHNSSLVVNWQHQFKKVSFRYQGTGDLEYHADDLIFYQSLSMANPAENILLANLRGRNNLTFSSPGQKRSIRVMTEHLRTQNTRDLHSESLSRKDGGEIRWRLRGNQGYQEYTLLRNTDRRERFPLGTYSVSNERLGGGGAFNWSPHNTADLGISSLYIHINSTFREEDFSSRLLETELTGTWSRIPGEQINGRIRLAQVNTGYDGPLPYEVANGLPSGRTLQVMLRYEKRLSDMLTLNGTFQYRKRGESKPITLIRVEARAYL
jgi:hypothetical protein